MYRQLLPKFKLFVLSLDVKLLSHNGPATPFFYGSPCPNLYRQVCFGPAQKAPRFLWKVASSYRLQTWN